MRCSGCSLYYQLVRHELPCPICLLQRAGLIIAGFGFLFNLCFGLRGIHYGMVIIGSILTGVMASRQICLHIMPGDTGYGSAFLDYTFIPGLWLRQFWLLLLLRWFWQSVAWMLHFVHWILIRTCSVLSVGYFCYWLLPTLFQLYWNVAEGNVLLTRSHISYCRNRILPFWKQASWRGQFSGYDALLKWLIGKYIASTCLVEIGMVMG